MATAPARTVFDVITDFLASNPTPEQILSFRLPPEMEVYASHLLERRREKGLSQDDELELFDFVRADDLMALLKAKTRLKLSKK